MIFKLIEILIVRINDSEKDSINLYRHETNISSTDWLYLPYFLEQEFRDIFIDFSIHKHAGGFR